MWKTYEYTVWPCFHSKHGRGRYAHMRLNFFRYIFAAQSTTHWCPFCNISDMCSVSLVLYFFFSVGVAVALGSNMLYFPLQRMKGSMEWCVTAQDCGDVWRDVCDGLSPGMSSGESQYACYLTTKRIFSHNVV